MREKVKFISAVTGKIIFLGFGVQILSGMLWMLYHLGCFQEFGDSLLLVKSSVDLICDEYMGIAYVFLIRLLRGIFEKTPIPYFSVLYVLQLLAGTMAAFFFFGSFERFREAPPFGKLWAILSVLTFPCLLQVHMAVLPYSFAASLFLLQLGLLERTIAKPSAKAVALQGILWVLEILVLPEYKWFGIVLLLAVAIVAVLFGEQSERIPFLLGIAVVTAVFLGIGSRVTEWTTQEGALGRIQRTRQAAAFCRYGWDEYGDFSQGWPSQLRAALTPEEVVICKRYPQEKLWILGEKVDKVYGRETAGEWYEAASLEMKTVCPDKDRAQLRKDLLCYGFVPHLQLLLMKGKGQDNFSGMNYDIMRAEAPKLTSFFVRYGYGCFLVAFVLSMILGALNFLLVGGKTRFHFLGRLTCYGSLGFLISFWYCMQGCGMMDYKNTTVVTALWVFWICLTAVGSLKKEQA